MERRFLMSEDHLVRYCAPTLAGIKTGSLFGCPISSAEELRHSIRKLNKKLTPKGLRILPLHISGNKALMYAYRPSGLHNDLSQEAASQLLQKQGYCTGSCEHCIAQLCKKLQNCEEFPHEIGLFLGYPPEDVAGFMEHKACNCKCSGCWKVYGDVAAAKKKFDQYRKCSWIYQQCWENGSSLERLTVSK